MIGNDGWEASATDILGIHDYDCDPERLQARYAISEAGRTALFDQRRPGGRILTLDGFPHRGQPIVLTEFGGIAFDKEQPDESATWGYARVGNEDGFSRPVPHLMSGSQHGADVQRFLLHPVRRHLPGGERLADADRTPKAALELLSAATRNIRLN